ncbi:MAG: LCP family protein [Candidatus Humimicrobiaceae bacterium]|jgi:LCP family protein required for cell wall assembly|nr:LCP family protein [Candidatus Humimicrobiaceae bacterium]
MEKSERKKENKEKTKNKENTADKNIIKKSNTVEKNKKNKKKNTIIKTEKTIDRRFKGLPLYIKVTIIVVSSIILISGISAGVFFLYIKSINRTINSVTTAEIENILAPIESPEDPVTILILGRDTRDADSDTGRADIIMVAHLNPEKNTATLLSIPRDCLVEIPGYGEDKINAAYAYGKEELMIKTVSSFLGAEINHYIAVDFDGFIKLIDALGGVDITIDRPIIDPKSGANLSSGTHHLTGEQALAYTRSRSTELGDIGRIQRQQQLIKALMEQKLNAKYLSSAPYYFNILADNTRTDLDILTILKYSKALLSLDSENFNTAIVPSYSDWIKDGTVSVQIPDVEEARAMWQRIIRGEPASIYNAEYTEVDEISGIMTQNTEYKFKIKVKNTGALEWNRNGDNPVYLGYHWIDFRTKKVVVFDGKRSIISRDGVDVGEEEVFDLTVVSPAEPGEYILQIDLVQEGVTWFSYKGVPPLEKYVSVDITYGAEYYDGGKTPNYVKPGEEFEVKVKVKNSGFQEWEYSGEKRISLGTHWIDRDTREVVIWDGERGLLDYDVSHGEEIEVNIKVEAPDEPGRYILQYDMVHERVTWFSEKGVIPLEVNIDVGDVIDRVVARRTTVKVYNGNGIPGSADEIKNYIKSYGFRIYALANAENFNFDKSILVYNEGCEEKARQLSMAFDNLEVCEYNKTWSFYKTDADLMLIVGKDYSEIMR